MLDVDALVDADLKGLSPEVITTLAQRMLGQLREHRQLLQQRDECIAQQASEIAQKAIAIEHQAEELQRKDAELQFKTAKLEKVTFELARLKAWKFGAKTEAMNAEQRRLFEETMAEDEASLKALLEQLQGKPAQGQAATDQRRRKRLQADGRHGVFDAGIERQQHARERSRKGR